MAKYVKNDSGVTKTWVGQELVDQAILEIVFSDNELWAERARESGGVIETDTLSGDIKVSMDNFATTLSATDGLFTLKAVNADCIRNTEVDESAKAEGKGLVYRSGKLKYEAVGSGYIDGGKADTNYGAIDNIDGGTS